MIFPSTASVVWGCAIGYVVFFVELLLARRWNYRFSTTGIPIFVRRVESVAGLSALSLDRLQRSAASSWLIFEHPVFRHLGAEVIAFQQMGQYGFVRRRPLVRGVIRREAGASSIAVIGYMNWYTAVGLVIAMLWMYRTPWMEALIVVAFAGVCWMDIARFRRVAAAVADGVSAPVAHHDAQLA